MSSSNSLSNSSSLVQPIVVAVSGDVHPVDATVPLCTPTLPNPTPTSSNAAPVDRLAVNAAATKQLHLKLLDVEASLEKAAIVHAFTTASRKGAFGPLLRETRRGIRSLRENVCEEARQEHDLVLPVIKFTDPTNPLSLYFSKAFHFIADPHDVYRKHLELSPGLSTPVIRVKFNLLLLECKELLKRVAEHEWFDHTGQECESIIRSLSELHSLSHNQFTLEEQSPNKNKKGASTPNVIHRINSLHAGVSRVAPNQKRSRSEFYDESDPIPRACDVALMHRKRSRPFELTRTAALLAPSEDDW
jgi:hypothetical protein